MKTKLLLRLGLSCMCLIIGFACNGNSETPRSASQVTESAFLAGTTAKAVDTATDIPSAGQVYVCKSAGAKKYHLTDDCRGLNNCKHPIVKMAQKDAEGRGLGLCGWED